MQSTRGGCGKPERVARHRLARVSPFPAVHVHLCPDMSHHLWEEVSESVKLVTGAHTSSQYHPSTPFAVSFVVLTSLRCNCNCMFVVSSPLLDAWFIILLFIAWFTYLASWMKCRGLDTVLFVVPGFPMTSMVSMCFGSLTFDTFCHSVRHSGQVCHYG